MSDTSSTRVIVGLSGGVDSAVAALLLKQSGYAVEGLFMKNWEEDDDAEYCSAAEDLADAQAVCARLDIPLHTRNFSAEYWDRVFSHFLAEYRAGRTPNPDVLCNREIKFKAFLDHALDMGAQYMATGHYARIHRQEDMYELHKGIDSGKDQSYFLYLLGQTALRNSLFPLGELPKSEVRRLAAEAKLPNHDKRDSTGICFIGERNFKEFLNRYLPAQPGKISTESGEIIGQHSGLMYYTLGQRKGLGIGGLNQHGDAPWFVIAKDLPRNTLIVAQGDDHPSLFSSTLTADQLNWIDKPPIDAPYRCRAKTRYRQSDQDCTITALSSDKCEVSFDRPQRSVTPGQSVVFYADQHCLGGGTIDSTG